MGIGSTDPVVQHLEEHHKHNNFWMGHSTNVLNDKIAPAKVEMRVVNRAFRSV